MKTQTSNIYNQKSRWKVYLAIAGIIIILISAIYTYFLYKDLATEEQKKVEQWAAATEVLSLESQPLECDLTLPLTILENNTNIPVILVDEDGIVEEGRNFGAPLDTNITFLTKQLNLIKASGNDRIIINGHGGAYQYVYYRHSKLLQRLRWMPVVQFGLIAAFIGFGYLAFSAARRTEQNLVWVGMAKETAHQLGTPISGMVAWVDHLKAIRPDDEDIVEVANDLEADVNRLQLIADRFSKIGAQPVLESSNIKELLTHSVAYMDRRSSSKININLDAPEEPIYTMINPPLFEWVTENLLRNAVDAMDGEGTINIIVSQPKPGKVHIDISDNGSGIPPKYQKTIFEPGFTTKSRGWGLGLSLAKRIIESYHGGKLILISSSVGEGTTMGISLESAEK